MTAKEALKLWMGLSPDVRSKILSNVWCGQCRTTATICDYNVAFDRGVIALRGFCSVCGHKVARVLEGSREKSKNPRKCALEYYIFDIWIAGKGGVYDFKDKVLRKIQIARTKSLYNFAKVITKAFNFYFDHCFGFYNNFQRYYDSTKAYELFVDIGEEPLTPITKGVKKTSRKIKSHNLNYCDKQGRPYPVKFISYVWKRIDGFIIDYLKKINYHQSSYYTIFDTQLHNITY